MPHEGFSLIAYVYLLISTKLVCQANLASLGYWTPCAPEESSLTLWRISLEDCTYECQMRGFCAAISYNHVRSRCAMVSTESREAWVQDGSQSCMVIKKNVINQLATVSTICQRCDNTTVCMEESGDCIVKKCRKPHVENGVIKGNILTVGSRVKVECDEWFELDGSNDQMSCQENGNWSSSYTCEPRAACGPPPPMQHALAVSFDPATSVMQYACAEGGYSTLDVNTTLNVQCKADQTWAVADFVCITCGPPPQLSNAVAVGVNVEANGVTYVCCDGCLLAYDHSDMTLVCQDDGTWGTVGFACIMILPIIWQCIGSSCYYTPGPGTVMNFVDSQDYCARLDAASYLLQLETEEESNAVKSYLLNNYGVANWWLGVSDLAVEGTWVWTESGNQVTFTDWINPPEERSSYNFAIIQDTTGWYPITKKHIYVPVCEKSANLLP